MNAFTEVANIHRNEHIMPFVLPWRQIYDNQIRVSNNPQVISVSARITNDHIMDFIVNDTTINDTQRMTLLNILHERIPNFIHPFANQLQSQQ